LLWDFKSKVWQTWVDAASLFRKRGSEGSGKVGGCGGEDSGKTLAWSYWSRKSAPYRRQKIITLEKEGGGGGLLTFKRIPTVFYRTNQDSSTSGFFMPLKAGKSSIMRRKGGKNLAVGGQ